MTYIEELRACCGSYPLVIAAAGAVVRDGRGAVLLLRRTDNGAWCLPGGILEPGETTEQTARREVAEECGLHLGGLRLLGIFSGEGQHYTYPNGDEVYFINVLYLADSATGDLAPDSEESVAAGYFPLDDLPAPLSPPNVELLAHVALLDARGELR